MGWWRKTRPSLILETKRSSWRHIWEQEMKERFTRVGKPALNKEPIMETPVEAAPERDITQKAFAEEASLDEVEELAPPRQHADWRVICCAVLCYRSRIFLEKI